MVLPARMRCDQTPAWRALQAHFNSARVNLRDAFSADAQRFARFSQAAPHVFADLSKNLIDPAGEALLLDLAQQCGVAGHRDAMFAGAPVNTTEQRAAMHFLLRTPADAAVPASQQAELQAVHATLDAFLAFASRCGPTMPSPTWSTSALAAPTSGRTWRCGRWKRLRCPANGFISCPTSTPRNCWRCCARCSPNTRCSWWRPSLSPRWRPWAMPVPPRPGSRPVAAATWPGTSSA